MNKLKKNLIYNITYQILILFLPLVTTSYLSRIIGAEGIGEYSYTYSIALYFTYFTMLGLNKYGNRIIASVQKDKDKVSKNFFEIYTMQMVCFLISFAVYMVYALFFAENKELACLQAVFVLSAAFDINWFFFGMEFFDKTVIRNVVVKVATTLLIFIFVKDSQDVGKYTFIMAMGYLITQLAIWPYMRGTVVRTKIKLVDIKPHIVPNVMMFLPVIAVSIYKVMDKIMLGMMSGTAEVGFYENAEKIINVPIAIITALGTVMLPRVTAMIAEGDHDGAAKYRDQAMIIVTAFTVAAAFGIVSVASELSLWMFGNGFEESGEIMKYLAITIIFLGGGNVIRTQYLIPYCKDKIYIISGFLGAIVNFIVNLILIPQFGAIGAAIGTICAEASVCAYQFIKIRKYIPIKVYIKDVLAFSLMGIFMSAVLNKIPQISSLLVDIVLEVIIGMAIFVVMFVLYYFVSLKNRMREGK